MAVIISNMDFPTECLECSFTKNYRTNDYGSHCECELDDEYRVIDLLLHNKPDWCPLKSTVGFLDKINVLKKVGNPAARQRIVFQR